MNKFLAASAVVAISICGTGPAMSAVRADQILMQGNLAGAQTVTNHTDRAATAEFSFNDRGRGDHVRAVWQLDKAGVPTSYEGHGNDYMKAAVSETFRITAGKATWRNRAEHGEQSIQGEAFYVPANPPPEFSGVLARALLKSPDHRLRLLPAGDARIDVAGSLKIPFGDGPAHELTQYWITGLDFSPTSIWLDQNGDTAAILSGWFSVLEKGYGNSLAALSEAEEVASGKWSRQFAEQQTHVPQGPLVIRNARLYDPRDLSVTPGTSVLIKGARIVRVTPDNKLEVPEHAEVIDAHGRFLMPGLWDNHQHLSGIDGALDIANGVTSARDMANDTDAFPKRVERFDSGAELGPRVFKAGIIDGKGPLAGPTKMLVDSPQDAIGDVDWYADHGYGQIKIYSSVKPDLVALIADEAHARGLRVSGHVPAFMSAQQFVEAGADEIQHLNFIVLNFMTDTVKDTRDMTRFTAVAQHAREFTPDVPRVRDFIEFLRAHHTVLDPTMNVFEAFFSGDPTAVVPGLETIVPRFPAQVRRNQLSGALVAPKGQEDAYRAAFPSMLKLLKALSDAGVTIIPGTDSLAGYGLLHELELYANAGIPPLQVLRMATLTSAHVSGVESERGVIAAGRVADMILVDGDPSINVSDLHRVDTVIKGGKVFYPTKIESALGIAPRSQRESAF